jgi:hypothetical protein
MSPVASAGEPGQAEPGVNVHVVFDPDDSLQCLQLVLRLDCRAAGRVVCHPAPDATSSAWFAVDLLLALGKRFDAVRVEHAVHRSWQLTSIWMLAEQVTDLFVLRADRLPAGRWHELLRLARRCRLRLWLIVHRPDLPPSQHRLVAADAYQPLALEQFPDPLAERGNTGHRTGQRPCHARRCGYHARAAVPRGSRRRLPAVSRRLPSAAGSPQLPAGRGGLPALPRCHRYLAHHPHPAGAKAVDGGAGCRLG